MREFVKSSFSLGIALSLFALKQTENLFATEDSGRKSEGTNAIESVRNAAVDQLGGTLRNTFSALDNVQRGLVEIGYAFLFPPIEMPWNSRVEDSRSSNVFRDETSFDSRRATILRSRRAHEDERFTDQPTEILVGRRS
jgi:hypothetical protein